MSIESSADGVANNGPQGPWDVVVVGSGLSGLTSAAYLAANGKKVLVLEQYDVAEDVLAKDLDELIAKLAARKLLVVADE